jgi:hypothetical protein
MPAKKRPKPLYQRGKFSLYARDDRPNLEIVWYDAERKRERSASAGTPDVGKAKRELDRLYLEDDGQQICPTCRRPWDDEESPYVATVITDYLIGMTGKPGEKSAKTRLALVTDYLIDGKAATRCAQVDTAWIDGFRAWMAKRTYTKGQRTSHYSLSHIEGAVMQLSAAFNARRQAPDFTAIQQKEVARSPRYRANIETLAAMFRHAMELESRANLLAYLRMAVATWARPDAIYEVRSDQWHSDARVLELNPIGRRQTRKFRPTIPVAKQFAPWLDDFSGNWLAVSSIRHAWDKMAEKLNLPKDRQAGEKLVRRSVSTIARKRIGEANWAQGQIILGHAKMTISDIYALPDPANLGLALAATESIIDDIEKLAPGAFYRKRTAKSSGLSVINGGRNG